MLQSQSMSMTEPMKESRIPESLKQSLEPVLKDWVGRMKAIMDEIKMSPTEGYPISEFMRTIHETMAILISQGAMECPRTIDSRPAHRFFSELREDILLEKRMRDMGCEFNGRFPDWISDGLISYLEERSARYGIPKPYKKDTERRKRIQEASKDALLTVDLNGGLGGGVTIPIRFEGNKALIEHAGGVCVYDHVKDFSRELTSDERDLLLDLVISMKSKGDCTYPSSRDVFDGGGCSMSFRGQSIRTIKCESYFNIPYDLDRLGRFTEFLLEKE